jgi:hypothetical protein
VSKLEGYLKLNRTWVLGLSWRPAGGCVETADSQYAFYDRVNASLGDIPPAGPQA